MRLSHRHKRGRRRIKVRRQNARRNRRSAKRHTKVEATRRRLAEVRRQKRFLATWEKNVLIYEDLKAKGRELDLPATIRIVQAAARSHRVHLGMRSRSS